MQRVIAVVGPSGVGKDSVMDGLAAQREDTALVRRVITRPSEAGGEAFDGVSDAEFQRRADAQEFALHWQAHGLRYGIPKAALVAAPILLVNLSRGVLTEAAEVFDDFRVLSLTARPEVLAERLAGRGRETAEDIARRLARSARVPDGLKVHTIDNSGALADTLAAAQAALFADIAPASKD